MSVYIKTKSFNISEKEFKTMIAHHYFKRMKVLLIVLGIFTLINIASALISQNYFGTILFLALLTFYLCLPYLINTKKTQAKINFISRFCEIDENFISFIYEDGSLSKMRFDNFIQVNKELNYYFLYTIKNQFHYLPIDAFNTEQEISRFELLMEGKQLLKLWK